MDCKVLVTGANGYIGRHVVRELISLGCRVIACDLSQDGLPAEIEYCPTPIFSGDENIFVQTGSPDILIHLAWRDGFIHNAPSHIEDLPKHYLFLKNMLAGGLKNLSVMGTMHEVGFREGEINEDTPANPFNMYGIAKNALRQSLFVLTNNSDISVHWLRAFYICGDDTRNHSIFSKILGAESKHQEFFPLNSGKNEYDFISVELLAEQIAKAALQDKEQGIINCCTGKRVSLAEKVEEFIREKDLKIRPQYNVFPDRPYDSKCVWGNPEKIHRILQDFE